MTLKPALKDLWKHWAEYNNVSEEVLNKWIADPNRLYHCVFCGRHGTLEDAFTISLKNLIGPGPTSTTACPVCRKYKGVEPCIPEYCNCWPLDVIRKLSEKEATND